MPMITNAQAARAVCWSRDERWTRAYRALCYAQLRAKQEGLPQVCELINRALDELTAPSPYWEHGEFIDTT